MLLPNLQRCPWADPLSAGCCCVVSVTIGLPIFLPLIILGLIGAAIALSAAVVIGLSSRAGRAAIQRATDPIVFKLTQTAVGQQVGPACT